MAHLGEILIRVDDPEAAKQLVKNGGIAALEDYKRYMQELLTERPNSPREIILLQQLIEHIDVMIAQGEYLH